MSKETKIADPVTVHDDDVGEFKPSDALNAAIEARVESDMSAKATKSEKSSKPRKAKEISSPEVPVETQPESGSDKGKGNAEVKADETPVEIPDELVERAVKAGLSISDARSFKDVSALERIAGILEQRAKPAEKVVEKAEKQDEGDDLSKVVADIPDEFDADVYDENFIKLAKTFKKVVMAQQAEIKMLRDMNISRNEQSWFEGQVSALGEDAVKSLDAGKKGSLETKFKVLEAGYKAAGQSVKREDVFKEAAKLVLGEPAATEKKSAAGADRSSQIISRPGANRVAPKEDPREEVAGEIRRWKERNVA